MRGERAGSEQREGDGRKSKRSGPRRAGGFAGLLPFRDARIPIGWRTMILDFTALEPKHAYNWMISTIVPRPIAWVSTISPEGRTNLAPYSFFQGVTANPPTLMFVPVNTRDGKKKDTVRNIEAVPEFVVNLTSFALAEKMNATAALLPYGESEFEAFGIAAAPSVLVKPPRVAEAGVSFECTLPHDFADRRRTPGGECRVWTHCACAHPRRPADARGTDRSGQTRRHRPAWVGRRTRAPVTPSS
jgi:flavin reductase (DIM6/NTAB) family NADH-FMN oxidoreductase RutF